MTDNSVPEIREFFGTEEKPVGLKEFKDFWESCSPAERAYYKTAKLS